MANEIDPNHPWSEPRSTPLDDLRTFQARMQAEQWLAGLRRATANGLSREQTTEAVRRIVNRMMDDWAATELPEFDGRSILQVLTRNDPKDVGRLPRPVVSTERDQDRNRLRIAITNEWPPGSLVIPEAVWQSEVAWSGEWPPEFWWYSGPIDGTRRWTRNSDEAEILEKDWPRTDLSRGVVWGLDAPCRDCIVPGQRVVGTRAVFPSNLDPRLTSNIFTVASDMPRPVLLISSSHDGHPYYFNRCDGCGLVVWTRRELPVVARMVSDWDMFDVPAGGVVQVAGISSWVNASHETAALIEDPGAGG